VITNTENKTKITTKKFMQSIRPKEINVDLLCMVKHRGNKYVFNQPVLLRYTITHLNPSTSIPMPLSTSSFRTKTTHSTSSVHTLETTTSTSSPDTVNASIPVSVTVVLLSLILSVSVVFYYKRNAKKGHTEVLSKIKWENNPDYLDTLDEADGPLLPEWLHGRKEIIYDQSCIEKGEKSWHGHFGSVYEAKIRLGNAV
jgi:hypothetical protein